MRKTGGKLLNPCMFIYTLFFIVLSGFSIYGQSYTYAVVISSQAYSETGWKTLADSLLKKHSKRGLSRIFTWSSSVTELKDDLSEFKPDYIGFIARPVAECNSSFIVAVSQMTRELDSDPYGDAIWGIITGYNSSDAMRAISDSLTVKTVLSASGNLPYEPPIQRFYEAIGLACDSYTKADYIFANNIGKVYSENKRPDNEQDRIKFISKWLGSDSLNLEISGQGTIHGPIDCIITGGHGNVNMWQCHYPEAGTEGYMQSSGGKIYGRPYSGSLIEINAKTPKIFWCLSNCLMGNPDNKDNFVYGAFGSGRAVQMFGFVNNASSGNEFMAWGVYDRITKRAGKYTLPQGFFLSNNNALFEIENGNSQINTRLVKQFMDSTVFYGDPAADVNFYDFGDSAKAFKTDIVYTENSQNVAEFTLTYTMKAHDLEYGTGYCYQFRPVELLPVRIDPTTVEITHNEGYHAEITDNLVIWEMLSGGEKLRKGESRKLGWSAEVKDNKTDIGKAGYRTQKKIRKPALFAVSGKNGVVVQINDFPSGNFNVKIVDLTGKKCFSDKFVSKGGAKQSFSTKFTIGSGVYMVVLDQENLKLSSVISHCCLK